MHTSIKMRGLAALLLSALAMGCSDPTGSGSSARVRAELVRLPGTSFVGASETAPAAPTLAPESLPPGSYPWTSRVTLTSVRVPIVAIRLRDPSRVEGAELYECPGASGPDCMVELLGAELQNLLGTSPMAVRVGRYSQVELVYCKAAGETGARVAITGTTTIGGTSYYTRSSGVLGSAGPAEPVTITFPTGCGASYPITPPLAIDDSTTATTVLRLYYDVVDLASASLAASATTPMYNPAVCTPLASPGTAPFLCTGYPTVIAVVGTTPPVLEHYRVNTNATVGLMFDPATDDWLGGYFRRNYVEDQPFTPGFTPDGGIRSFTNNGDGTYRLYQGLDSGGRPMATFPSWRRAPHTGTLNFGGANPTPYSAVKP